MFLVFEFVCGTPPSCLKVGGWVVVGGLPHFSVSPRPLGLGFLALGLRGLVPELDKKSDYIIRNKILQFSVKLKRFKLVWTLTRFCRL